MSKQSNLKAGNVSGETGNIEWNQQAWDEATKHLKPRNAFHRWLMIPLMGTFVGSMAA